VIGDDGVTVDADIDFLCPYCKLFEETSGPLLGAMVADGSATVIYHPMGSWTGCRPPAPRAGPPPHPAARPTWASFPNLHTIAEAVHAITGTG
jgi:hypothetical protein